MHRLLDEAFGTLLADDARALFPQAALVAGVLAIDFLIFLATRQLHFRGIDHDDMVAGVDECGVGGFVLALEQACGQRRNAAEHFAIGVDDVPPPGLGDMLCSRHERRHSRKASLRNPPVAAAPLERAVGTVVRG